MIYISSCAFDKFNIYLFIHKLVTVDNNQTALRHAVILSKFLQVYTAAKCKIAFKFFAPRTHRNGVECTAVRDCIRLVKIGDLWISNTRATAS